MTTHAPQTRLMLVTPIVTDPEAMAFRLMQAFAGGDVAAVLLRLAQGDDRSRIEAVKRLAAPVQAQNVALIVEASALVAARGGADGVHLTDGPEAVAEARSSLKSERIIGAGSLRARHDAMDIGEAGVDYVMFGATASGRLAAAAARRDRGALAGGLRSSRPLASPMRPMPSRSPRWSRPAPNSSRWATGFSTRAATSALSSNRPTPSSRPMAARSRAADASKVST